MPNVSMLSQNDNCIDRLGECSHPKIVADEFCSVANVVEPMAFEPEQQLLAVL
jgi:hypothetical protein